MAGRKILCELKRDYHAEVWAAAVEQLERFYAHDPEAKGFGIYCVFWFGDKRPKPIPSPPGALNRPQSVAEMKQILPDGLGRRVRKPGPGDRNSARRGGRNRAGRRRRRADRDLYDVVPHRV